MTTKYDAYIAVDYGSIPERISLGVSKAEAARYIVTYIEQRFPGLVSLSNHASPVELGNYDFDSMDIHELRFLWRDNILRARGLLQSAYIFGRVSEVDSI